MILIILGISSIASTIYLFYMIIQHFKDNIHVYDNKSAYIFSIILSIIPIVNFVPVIYSLYIQFDYKLKEIQEKRQGIYKINKGRDKILKEALINNGYFNNLQSIEEFIDATMVANKLIESSDYNE